MHRIRNILASAGLAVSVMISQAHADNKAFMKTGATTSQPVGHYEFCRRYPRECAAYTRIIPTIALTKNTWDTILKINYRVNKRVRPATDPQLYGKEEYWAYPVNNAGDCEDYVLQKRREFYAKGFPLSALLITVVNKPNGEGHAVLTIRTDHGDFVLDNLRDEVLNWRDTQYTYLKRQSAQHPGIWVAIEKPSHVIVDTVSSAK